MAVHVTAHRQGFQLGLTDVLRGDDAEGVGIALTVCRLKTGGLIDEMAARETAWLLVEGKAVAQAGGRSAKWRRRSLFDGLPSALHVSAGERLQIRCEIPSELIGVSVANTRAFAPRFYAARDVRTEARGKGKVKDGAFRLVRTIFDGKNSDPQSELVLGEVVTLPGRWSSYPPHHHPQPEIYHYRFAPAHGYGHAEMGEQIFKVRHNDTVKILPGCDHAQVAAPGYAMYYLWAIRHLEGARYRAPEFVAEHAWTMKRGARCWWPRGGR